MALHKTLFLDLPDEVEQLLRAAHREAGNDHIAAPVEGALQNFGQLPDIVRAGAVEPVAVGGFHHNVICVGEVGRVLDEGLVLVADIAGEDELGGGAVLGDPDLDAGRAEQMANVHKLDLQARCQLGLFPVLHPAEQPDGRLGVLNGVHRFHRFCTGALALAVFPLGLELLNVGRVPQHDAAQLHRGVGGIDPAPEPVADQQRQKARMVDVGMGDQHAIDLSGGHRDGLVFVHILALLHAAVDEVALPGRFQQRTAARYLVVRAQKRQFHRLHPLSRCFLPPAAQTGGAKRREFTYIIPYFRPSSRPNHGGNIKQNAEFLKKFLYNLDKPPPTEINLIRMT